MIFERTLNGLRNEHLFYGVDIVVYCEGREADGATHDEMFWSRVLSAHGVRCVCKSRGSKTNIMALIESTRTGGVDGVAFAMDRDYSNFYGFPAVGDNILYTYGYSWENDILFDIDAESLFGLFAPLQSKDSVQRDVGNFLLAVADCANQVARLDVINAPTSSAIFDRDKPLSIILGSGDDLRFDEPRFVARSIEIAAPVLVAVEILDQITWLKDFYGKACARLVYQWFVDRSKGYTGRSKIPYDVFLRMCIALMKFDPDMRERDAHYRDLASRLLTASIGANFAAARA